MDLCEIKEEYKLLLEYTYFTQGMIEILIPHIKNFLTTYYKTKNFNETITDNLELNLVYLEKFYNSIENIAEIMENITLNKINSPQAKIYSIENFKNKLINNNYFYLDLKDYI